MAGFAHETVLHLHAVGDAAAFADDGVLADDTRADVHVGGGRAQNGAVA